MRKPGPISIRAVRPGDRSALALVYQAAFSAEPSLEKWTLRASDARVAEVLRSRHSAWVACLYGQPVGFAFLATRVGHDGSYGELTELAVHPFFRRGGIGSRLWKIVKASRKKLKLKTIYTLVYRGKTENFFRKNGWKPSRRSLVMAVR
ncbi:MAG: GNAT family N-acetyltransferase [bacterium]